MDKIVMKHQRTLCLIKYLENVVNWYVILILVVRFFETQCWMMAHRP